MKSDLKFNLRKRKQLTTAVGLVLDGGKLEGVVLRRTDGALQKLQTFSAPLTLDPLTAAPELVGREIRNQLDAAGVRERDCVVGVPLKWILTAQTELPPLPPADAASLLQLEAEKGFHTDPATLQVSNSFCALADGKSFVLQAAVPGTHIAALEQVLSAARLRPASLTPGISAMQPAAKEKGAGVMTLVVGEGGVALQVTCGGGIAALRALDGVVEAEGGRRTVQADVVAREARVTLGQLPGQLREQVKQVRVYGPRELAQPLADEMELRFEPMGLKVDVVTAYAPGEFGVTLPVDAPVSPAFSLAARALMGQAPAFEFLPPKPTLVEQLVTKYSSGRLRTSGAIGVGVAALVLLIFLFQQFQLWRLNSQWARMAPKVTELKGIEAKIAQYRPWYAGDYRNLEILRALSVAFPQDGEVTAKVITIRDDGTVNCAGIAENSGALLAVETALSTAPGISDVHREQSRGSKPPIQFVFNFKFNPGAIQ
jgi:hypothetical protein